MTELKPIFGQGRWIILCWLLLLGLNACKPSNSTERSAQHAAVSPKTQINHAIGFDVNYFDGWKELMLFRHYNDHADTVRFALANEPEAVPQDFAEPFIIQTPVASIAALSTTQLTMFELLEATDHLGAVETSQYVYSETIRDLIKEDKVIALAPSGQLNIELTLNAGVDVIMGVGYPNSQNKDYQTLQRSGVPVILNADWQEKTLLGRAEWIKLLGVLLNKEEKANEVFGEVEAAFNETLRLLASEVQTSPSVITGLAQGDSWYVAGGNSFANHILSIAQVDYPWGNTQATGSVRLDFETVYQEGLDADFWLVPSTAKSLEEIQQADLRYRDFKSFQEGNIYNIYGRYYAEGGNDYYESAVMAPHIVLKDIVKIFHPALLPEHQLVYYNRLQ